VVCESGGRSGWLQREATIHSYRIVQEALTNVSRHSGAKDARVRLAQRDGRLELENEDHALALQQGSDKVDRGIGLVSMRERAELMRGTFALRPAPGGGLIVSVRVPIVGQAVRPGRGKP